MLEAVNADCALMNSGSLRSDMVHPAGEFKVRDLKKILPYLDENIVLNVTGNLKKIRFNLNKKSALKEKNLF